MVDGLYEARAMSWRMGGRAVVGRRTSICRNVIGGWFPKRGRQWRSRVGRARSSSVRESKGLLRRRERRCEVWRRHISRAGVKNMKG
eukprot:7391479-Prymnesium_polylepis.2